MKPMQCPDCGSRRMYFKDPDDQYTLYEFELKDDQIVYIDQDLDSHPPRVEAETETFCDRCAWHDKFGVLKK